MGRYFCRSDEKKSKYFKINRSTSIFIFQVVYIYPTRVSSINTFIRKFIIYIFHGLIVFEYFDKIVLFNSMTFFLRFFRLHFCINCLWQIFVFCRCCFSFFLFFLFLFMRVYPVYQCVCVSVRVNVCVNIFFSLPQNNLFTWYAIEFICFPHVIIVCVCMCVCLCVRARVCVCIFVYLSLSLCMYS